MHCRACRALSPPRPPCPRTWDLSVRTLVIVSCVVAAVTLSAVVMAVKQVGAGATTATAALPTAPAPVPAPARTQRPTRAETRPSLLPKSAPREPEVVQTGTCEASFYGDGASTASGEAFDPGALTAAHRTLPFGSRVRVTNRENAESVIVRINDRGPFKPGRCLDLSTAAMQAIGGTSSGVIQVTYAVLAA
jgi:rare lipoprotein A